MAEPLRQLVLSARARLVAAGIDAALAAMDAALLARHVLGWDRARFLAHDTDPAPEAFPAAFDGLVARRTRREPLSSITGWREFWGLDFEVTRDVLTPRPETEAVVEEAIACLAGGAGSRPGSADPGRFVDVGTGSGCLAICLAREVAASRVVATDISAAALAVARRNAARLGVADRVEFRRSSILDGISPPVALVVSNPPYVPTDAIPALMPEVRQWEPGEALDGGADGLDAVRALVAAAPGVLQPGGWLIMEFGYGQDQAVQAIVAESPLHLVRIRNDVQGIPRTLVARTPAD
jgi:release factor glutamine methyltransferase